MISIEFARAFRRHVDCPNETAVGATVREALDDYFENHPAVRTYVLDDAGALRRHVALFHNDGLVVDRETLADPVADGDRLSLFQALSGG